MDLTGGIHWHWRACRARHLWRTTAAQIESWLLAQPVPSQELIVIGASAGWMMSNTWLARYACVHTWDIDPWAARLFKWRHGASLQAQGVRLHCHTGDALVQLPQLLKAHPQATIFFDNVLGQIRFQSSSVSQAESRLSTIAQALQGRHWGSVHDRMSGPVHADWAAQRPPSSHLLALLLSLSYFLSSPICIPPPQTHPQGQDCEEHCSGESTRTQAWLNAMGAQSPWLDHLTGSIFPQGTMLTHFAWPLKVSYWHWLTAGWVTPSVA